ncbi:DUF2975 domain-containing protein [Anaerosinus massiliensis]|uniref:DUF2975 domain-containing protein n=1 Tax=Massilibacillus massiliensis TaxID=1806837 RepID=UPI000B1FA1D5|nr:DUF2975 domain-containing protein [Massilibacillus massiliensis]
MIRNEKLAAVVKYILEFILVGVSVLVLGLPIILKICFDNYSWTVGESYWFLLVFLWITGVLYFGVVYELRKMVVRLIHREPFMSENVDSLKRIAVLALSISAMYVIKIVFYISFLTVIVTMMAVLIGLFALILAEVFRQAIEVKEENDLTI